MLQVSLDQKDTRGLHSHSQLDVALSSVEFSKLYYWRRWRVERSVLCNKYSMRQDFDQKMTRQDRQDRLSADILIQVSPWFLMCLNSVGKTHK